MMASDEFEIGEVLNSDHGDNSTSGLNEQSKETSRQPEDPPDGGLMAWFQVMGAFFIFFNTW